MKYILFFAAFFIAYVGAVMPQPVYAQKLLKDFLKPMPEIPEMDLQEFKNSTTLYDEIPSNIEKLAYKVRLPKKWSQQETKSLAGLSISNRVLAELDRYYGPVRVGERSYFSIRSIEIDYKLTAEQWLVLYLLENGFTIEGIRQIDNGRVEVVYVLIDRDITYVSTGVAQITGNRVVFAQYVVPTEYWEEEKSIAQRVVQSFSLKEIDDGYVEPMTPYRFLDVAELKYPESWELVSRPLKSVDEMSVSFLNVQEINRYSDKRILKGKMEAHLLTDYIIEDIDEDIASFLQDMSEKQLSVQDVIEELDDFTVDEELDVIEIKAYEAVDKNQSLKAYEFWLAVMNSGDYYYFVTVLTPSRDEDYGSWARNTQTFRVLVESIEPLI